MNNSLDTSGTRQQMVSRLSAFSKAAKAHSEDQHPEDNGGDSTSTSDSSEARDPRPHKNDPGSDSSEAPAKPQSKRPRKRQREHTPSQAPQKVTLAEKGTVDATVHPPPPSPPPPPLLLRLPLARPVLPEAATHTKESTNAATHTEESTNAATTGAGDTLWGTTTQDPLHVPLLYLGACKIASDEVNLSCLISYYSLKMYRPHLKLARVMQSGVSGMLLTYLHGSRHGTDTYALGLPTTFPWLSSSSSIRQSW